MVTIALARDAVSVVTKVAAVVIDDTVRLLAGVVLRVEDCAESAATLIVLHAGESAGTVHVEAAVDVLVQLARLAGGVEMIILIATAIAERTSCPVSVEIAALFVVSATQPFAFDWVLLAEHLAKVALTCLSLVVAELRAEVARVLVEARHRSHRPPVGVVGRARLRVHVQLVLMVASARRRRRLLVLAIAACIRSIGE